MNKPWMLLRNGTIYLPDGPLAGGQMLVNPDGIIAAIAHTIPDIPPEAKVIDLDGRCVLPGLIDVHVHGGNGHDFMNGTFEDLDGMSRYHAQHGTTAFLATTGTDSEARITRAIRSAVDAMRRTVSGAELIGIHLEGPFLNPLRKGAMNADQFRLPDQREAARYLAAGEGHVRLVTMAPELPGGEPLVAYLAAQGIAVSIGHSDATFEETIRAVQLGATHTTHHFNGMRPLHHREPGVAGAGLMLPSLTTELIADGIHIHPAVVKLLYEIKGASQVCLITDAVRWAGLPDGTYGPYQVADGRVYIEGSDTLAGSSLTTLQALKNVMSFTGLPLEKVLPSFTMVPARQSGCSRIKGSLSSGKHADFLILDEDLTLLSTFVQGCKVYRKFE